MLLIAEIVLTIIAWGRGWKWYALIPVGIPLVIGLFLGLSGADPSVLGAFAILDIGAIIALIIMISKKKKVEKVD